MAAKKTYPDIKTKGKPLKKLVCTTVLFVLGRGFQSIAKTDPYVMKEVESWPEGFKIKMEILPKGPTMAMQKVNGRVKYLGLKNMDTDLAISFKNVDAAFALFTVQKNTYQAWTEFRMMIRGDLTYALSFVRALNIAEHYLFTWPIAQFILKRKPPMASYANLFLGRLRAYFVGIPLGL
ncbi:MAG: hypothetical protein ACM3QZ_01610 [Solirubrobacterales bacterium]